MSHKVRIDNNLEYIINDEKTIKRITEWLEEEANSVLDLTENENKEDRISDEIVLDYEGGEALNKGLTNEEQGLEIDLSQGDSESNESQD